MAGNIVMELDLDIQCDGWEYCDGTVSRYSMCRLGILYWNCIQIFNVKAGNIVMELDLDIQCEGQEYCDGT